MPSVSLVLTVLNEIETIPTLLRSIERQSEAIDSVIFVDGGSVDGTTEALARWCANAPSRRLIVSKGCNIAEGRNIGVAAAESEIILTTDAGCSLHDDWATRLVTAFDFAGTQSVKGSYVLAPSRTLWSKGVAYAAAPRRTSFARSAALASSRSFGFRREAWQELGGYPESLRTAEDTLFAERLAAYGKVGFAPDAVVSWPVRATVRETYRQYYAYAEGDLSAGTNSRLLAITAVAWLAMAVAMISGRRQGGLVCLAYLIRRLFGQRSTTVPLTPTTAALASAAIVVMDIARLTATLRHLRGKWMGQVL